MTDNSFEEMPIFMVRAVDERGGMMTGGAAQVGSEGAARDKRSCTNCLACITSVPASKIRTIDENCSTGLERMMSSPGMPRNACSKGIVTNASTSEEESPMDGV